MKILVVEDDPITTKVLKRAVLTLGHEPIMASDGLEALDKFQQSQPDVVITDWLMPKLEGPDLCRKIREQQTASYTYVIVLTGKGERSDRHEAISAGADDFLTKPLDYEELESRLKVAERILEMQSALHEKNAALERQQKLLAESNRKLAESQRTTEMANFRFESLFQNLPVPCFTFDHHCVIFEPNQKLAQAFNRPKEELFQREVVEVFGKKLITPKRLRQLQKVLSGQQFEEQDWNDGERYFLVSGYPIAGREGKITAGIASLFEITELRKIQAELRQLNDQLNALAVTDGLTQIPNHRAFQDALSQFFAHASRGRSFALVMLDVDNFKQFNDTFGHQAGDEVLIAVARTLKQNIRRVDFVARYGGEEFAVLFMDVDEARAKRLAEKLRKKISEISNKYSPVTASFGVALCCQVKSSEQSLIKLADMALYRAKASGKNCVVFAGDEEERSAA